MRQVVVVALSLAIAVARYHSGVLQGSCARHRGPFFIADRGRLGQSGKPLLSGAGSEQLRALPPLVIPRLLLVVTFVVRAAMGDI